LFEGYGARVRHIRSVSRGHGVNLETLFFQTHVPQCVGDGRHYDRVLRQCSFRGYSDSGSGDAMCRWMLHYTVGDYRRLSRAHSDYGCEEQTALHDMQGAAWQRGRSHGRSVAFPNSRGHHLDRHQMTLQHTANVYPTSDESIHVTTCFKSGHPHCNIHKGMLVVIYNSKWVQQLIGDVVPKKRRKKNERKTTKHRTAKS
jgi:hypothetical protein